jgi:hypothetical protein
VQKVSLKNRHSDLRLPPAPSSAAEPRLPKPRADYSATEHAIDCLSPAPSSARMPRIPKTSADYSAMGNANVCLSSPMPSSTTEPPAKNMTGEGGTPTPLPQPSHSFRTFSLRPRRCSSSRPVSDRGVPPPFFMMAGGVPPSGKIMGGGGGGTSPHHPALIAEQFSLVFVSLSRPHPPQTRDARYDKK